MIKIWKQQIALLTTNIYLANKQYSYQYLERLLYQKWMEQSLQCYIP